MKVLMINSVCGIRSTGRICTDLAQKFEKQGHEVKIAYGREDAVPDQFQKYAIRIGTRFSVKAHALRTRLLDDHGFGSRHATKKFLAWADEYDSDLLWLHNLHRYYINIDTTVFKPTVSDFYNRYGIEDKKLNTSLGEGST